MKKLLHGKRYELWFLFFVCCYYCRALKIIDANETSLTNISPEEMKQLQEIRVKCFNNLAAAQLKVSASLLPSPPGEECEGNECVSVCLYVCPGA